MVEITVNLVVKATIKKELLLPSTLLDMTKLISNNNTCHADNTMVSMYNLTCTPLLQSGKLFARQVNLKEIR